MRSRGLAYSLVQEGCEVGAAAGAIHARPGIVVPDPPTYIGPLGAQMKLPQAPWRLAGDGERIGGDCPPPLLPDRLTAPKSEQPLSPARRWMSFTTGRVEHPTHYWPCTTATSCFGCYIGLLLLESRNHPALPGAHREVLVPDLPLRGDTYGLRATALYPCGQEDTPELPPPPWVVMPSGKLSGKHYRQLLFSEAIVLPKPMALQAIPPCSVTLQADPRSEDATELIIQEITALGRRLEAMDSKISHLYTVSTSIQADIALLQVTVTELDHRLTTVEDCLMTLLEQDTELKFLRA
ncbi:hypothetical protein NDU88_005576 [Pleurodeles waltl]|uniref:Uncharacterized protein n=1 Tax=Pleurodeles waltl TaxID=8319 RepID=A0AAV7SM28_PLEWA|nr:hypothetical protein NDU88_005576 [Pleurodeles waltl]